MTNKQISDLFIKLAETPSPSGEETLVAKFIKDYLTKLGWKVWQDKSGIKNDSEANNVYAYLEIDKKYDTYVFSAHMDTVQKLNDKIKVNFDGKIFKSNGKTVLGADNKAGVTSLLTLATELNKKLTKHNILLFFPTREEAGIMGSSLFNPKGIGKIKFFFNIDAGGNPGSFVYKSLGYKNFNIIVNGLSAHAAKEYDKGKDAVKAASMIVSMLPIGKDIKEGTTLNVGSIHGGSATNVVCDLVELKGEYRAFSIKNISKIENTITQIVKKVEKTTGTKIDLFLDKKSLIPPFSGDLSSEIVEHIKKVFKSLKISPLFVESFSTSDACFYSGLGYQTISICRGGSKAHSVEETLKFKDLKFTISLLQKILYSVN